MGIDPGMIDLIHGVVCQLKEGFNPTVENVNRDSFLIVGKCSVTSKQFQNQGGGNDCTRLVTNSGERRSQQQDLNSILSAFISKSKVDTLELFVEHYLQVLHASTSENLSYKWKGLFGTLKKKKLKIRYPIYDAM